MKVQLSSFMTDVRGSIGSEVASRNHYGSFLRKRVNPQDIASSYKTLMRGHFSTVSATWKTLTDAQRNVWNIKSALFSFLDCFAQLKHLSGFNLYMSCNMYRALTGRSLLTVPPIPTTIMPILITACGIDFSSSYVYVTLSSTMPSSHVILFYASLPVSQGVSKYHGTFYYMFALDAYSALTRNISGNFLSRFGVIPAVGSKVFFKIVTMERFSGLISLPSIASTIVVP